MVIIRKLVYLHIPTVQHVSGSNRGRASSLTHRQGWFHGSASQGQPGTQTPSTSWLCLPRHSPPPKRFARSSTPQAAGGREQGGGARASPAGNARKLLTPFASVSTGHTCLPGDWEMAALSWGPAGYPVKTQALYHLKLRDNTGRYQTVLAWVVREDASEELSKSLSEVKEGAVQGSRGRASCAKPREVLTSLNQEQGWGAGWKPRSPQWLEGNRKRETW